MTEYNGVFKRLIEEVQRINYELYRFAQSGAVFPPSLVKSQKAMMEILLEIKGL